MPTSLTRCGLAVNSSGRSSASPRLDGSQRTSATDTGCASGAWNQALNCGNSGLPKVCHRVHSQGPSSSANTASAAAARRVAAHSRAVQRPGAASTARPRATA